MYSFVAATLVSAAFVSAQATFTVNTPASLVECQPAALTWVGGTAPYFLSIIPGGQASAEALESFPQQTGTTFTWSAVDIAAGTSITVQLRDGTGAVVYSDPVPIQKGSSSACVGTGTGTSASGSAASGLITLSVSSGASAISGGPSPTATVSGGSSISGASSRASASGSAAAPSGSSGSGSTNGADKVGAGMFGVAIAAIFAAFV